MKLAKRASLASLEDIEDIESPERVQILDNPQSTEGAANQQSIAGHSLQVRIVGERSTIVLPRSPSIDGSGVILSVENSTKDLLTPTTKRNTIHDGNGYPTDKATSSKNRLSKLASVTSSKVNNSHENSIENIDDDELRPIEVLFQFIQFYGKGDATNDSTVRSTLSNLSVSEIDSKDASGNTLLLLACQYRCEDLVRIILNKGADANSMNIHGVTGLHYACYRDSQSIPIARLLLQNGANPEAKEFSYGCTPLHYCASLGSVEFCNLLVTYGAQVTTYDYYNYTAIDYARETGATALVTFLNQIAEKNSFGRATILDATSAVPLDDPNWVGYSDPATGARYYNNAVTGESLWEQDFIQRMFEIHSQSSTDQPQKQSSTTSSDRSKDISKTVPNQERKGSDKKISLSIDSSPSKTNDESKSLHHTSSYTLTPKSHLKALNELRVSHEAEMTIQKQTFQQKLNEKQNEITQLLTDLKNLTNERIKLETDKLELQHKVDFASIENKHNSDIALQYENLLEILRKENQSLKGQLDSLQQELTYKQQKLNNLEETIQRLNLGQNEVGAKYLLLTEEHARQMKDKEAEYNRSIRLLEEKLSQQCQQQRTDMSSRQRERDLKDHEWQDIIERNKQQSNAEIAALQSELADLKRRFNEEKSQLEMELGAYQRRAMESQRRVDSVENDLRGLLMEVEEARGLKNQFDQLHKDLLREQQTRRRLHNELEDLKGKIRVYVRIRPMSKSEIERGCEETVLKDGKGCVVVRGVGNEPKSYDFDQVFGGADGNSQSDVFRDTKHLMVSVLDGYNVCIFAYGQTGAGKSFTMIGSADVSTCVRGDGEFDDNAGITPRAVSELFRLLKERESQYTYEIEVQMFQLYRDNLEDLLYDKKTKKFNESAPELKIVLAEHSATGLVQVEGAISMRAHSPQEVLKIFSQGSNNRTVAATKMNSESSRSHLICTILVHMTNRRTSTMHLGKLTLVDLAGSERLDKSGAMGDNLKEAQSINKSLSALGDVISALTNNQTHIPYRNHPLTMLMSDSIGGNSKTLMFINTSPADYNAMESNNSLSFGNRCKDVSNNPNNPAMQQAQLNALKKELNRLKKLNANVVSGTAGALPPLKPGNGSALTRPK